MCAVKLETERLESWVQARLSLGVLVGVLASLAGCGPHTSTEDGDAASAPALSAQKGGGLAEAAAQVEACAPPAGTLRIESLPKRQPSFSKGINLGNRLDAPEEGAWGATVRETDFANIADRGFDHVRIPVRFGAYTATETPHAIACSLLQRVDTVVSQALHAQLSVIIDVHHFDDLQRDPEGQRERFLAIWDQLSKRYADWPATLAFELLNEPNGNIDSHWSALAASAINRIRANDEDRLLIVESPNWARYDALAPTQSSKPSLELPVGDPNLKAAIHMYVPPLFTLQGEPDMGTAFQTVGVVFPGPPSTPITPGPAAESVSWVRDWFKEYNTLPPDTNPAGPAAIDAQVDAIVAFRESTGYDVLVTEWGVTSNADPTSRLNFARAVVEALTEAEVGYAVWDNGSSIQLLDSTQGTWAEPLTSVVLGEEG